MFGRLSILSATAALALCAPAFADDRGSMEDQLACTPDVYRLCSQYIPDEKRIVACLQSNVGNLSAACHKVFTRPPSATNHGNDDDED
jgi:hypothetical protein